MKGVFFQVIILLGIVYRCWAAFPLTQIGKSLTTFQTLAPNVVYRLNFSMSGTVIMNSVIQLSLSNRFIIDAGSLSNCKASVSSGTATTAKSCTPSYSSVTQLYTITFNGLFSTTSFYSFISLEFTISNPWAKTAETITVFVSDPGSGNILGSGSIFIDYIASTIQNCGITSSSTLTGDPSTHTLTLLPSRKLIANSFIIVQLPIWYSPSSTSSSTSTLTCTGLQNTDATNLVCNLQTISSTQYINITKIYTANQTVSSPVIITISPLRNPWSLAPFGPITFQIDANDGSGSLVSQSCTGVNLVVTQPNTLNTVGFSLSNTQISSTTNSILLLIKTTNPLPKDNTQIRITYGNQISINYAGTKTLALQTATSMLFTGVSLIDLNSGGTVTISAFSVTNPPSTKPFSITFGTEIVINSIGSFISIIFPSQLTIQIASGCSTNLAQVGCVVTSNSNLTLTLTNSLTGGTQIVVNAQDVTNGPDSIITNTFKIYTYYSSAQYDTLVDKVDTGVTLTLQANKIGTPSVTPGNLTTFAITTYTFDFTLTDPIPVGGRITIQFPTQVNPVSATLASASFSIAQCTTSLTGQILNIMGCFPTTAMTTLLTQIVVNGVRNPSSYQTTSTFKIQTFSVTSMINFVNSGITTTMNNATFFTSLAITPSNFLVHASNIYGVSLTHKVTTHQTGDYFILTLPSPMQYPSVPNCLVTSGISSITCVRQDNTNLKVIYGNTPSSTTVSITLGNIINYDIGDIPVTFNMKMYNTGDFLSQSSPGISVAFNQGLISFVTVSNDQNIALNQASSITLTVSTPFSLDSSFNIALTSMVITIPVQFTIGATCSSTVGTCTKKSPTQYQVSSVGLSVTNVGITMPGITLPFFNPSSTSFQLQYTYNGNNVSVIQSGVVVLPYCLSPCQRCSGSKIACVSCLPAPNTLVYYDPEALACQATCSLGKFPDATNQCQHCVSPCQNCNNLLDCTSCVSNTWLHLKRCLATCPDTFYNNVNGNCSPCQSPCSTCLTISRCTSCSIDFYFNFACVTAANCPTGTFPNAIAKNCDPCTSPCQNCITVPTKCTSCINSYLLISNINSCVQNCPAKMYQNGLECFNCVPPCDNCISASICSSCLTNFLQSGSCVSSTDCLIGTYPEITTKRCEVCPLGCSACSSSTICTACTPPIYFLYNFACINTCPMGTYKNGVVCQPCASPCSTCVSTPTTCTGCQSPKLYYNNQCLDTCPGGTFPNVDKCTLCLPTCETCTNALGCITCLSGLYLDSGNNCVTSCPSGTFGVVATRKCMGCISPCLTCKDLGTNCLSCESSKIHYQNKCLDTCPEQYFNVKGFCQTCSNCLNCLNAGTCAKCQPGFYLYNGVCLTSCPSQAPIQSQIKRQCIGCDVQCSQCIGSARNCTRCFNGQYLFNNDCVSVCPTGYIADIGSGSCIQPLVGRVIFFPCSFAWIACLAILVYSSCRYENAQTVTTLAAITALCEYVSWYIITFILQSDATLPTEIKNIFFIVGLAIIGLSLLVGVSYLIALHLMLHGDRGFQGWKEEDRSCVYSFRIISVFTGMQFRCFRFIYGRLFNRLFFSAYFANAETFLGLTNKLSYASILLMSFPMVAICVGTLYFKQVYDQTFFSCVDTIILGCLTMILIIIDSCKDKAYFEEMKGRYPFLKYRGLEGDSIGDLLSQQEIDCQGSSSKGINHERRERQGQANHAFNRQKTITQLSQEERQRRFRNINIRGIDLNRFGHLNIIQDDLEDKHQIKSLPNTDQLQKLQQCDPHDYENDDDLVHIKDKEYQKENDTEHEKELERQLENQLKRKQSQEQKDQEQLRKQLLQKYQKQKKQEQQKRQQEEERLRILKKLQDQQQQVEIQFPDIAIIEKHQGKWNDNAKKSPLQLLAKCKKSDEKMIGEKEKKKLDDLAKKNGLKQQFMQETFGIEKNHNAQLLNSIIDKHHGVKRDSVQQLFSDKSDPQVLQQLFGKNSDIDKDKLKHLMNHPNSQQILKKLTDKEQGLLSPQMAKELLSKDSKYSEQFMLQLFGGNQDLSQKKLQELLKNSKGKGKQSPLKALQKIGGKNLQNKEMLNNMLGQDAVLNNDQFTRVANDLSAKAIENLFHNRNESSDLIVKKILNNKKISLRGLAPILEDEQLLEDLAQALGDQNSNVEENLLNLFKNAQDIDPVKLGQLLRNPALVKKLLGNPVDPQFLSSILKKGSNTDMEMLAHVLKDMPDQQIQQIFQFDPQKNMDFKSLALLFEKNSKTDPELVKIMLQPNMVSDLYAKGNNDPKRLTKLVQKGANFDPEVIMGIYGKKNNHLLQTNRQLNKQADLLNKNDNIPNFKKNPFVDDENYSQKGDYRSEKGGVLAVNTKNMSRTDGGAMGFLSPLKINKKGEKNEEELIGDIINRETQYEVRKGMEEQDQQGEQIYYDESVKRKRALKKKKNKAGIQDIRLDAQQIYLQRIEAPHEALNRRKNIRKKKQKSSSTTNIVMEEDNDFIDLDF